MTRRAATHMLHVTLQLKSELENRVQRETGLLLADNEALLNLAHADTPLRMSDIAARLILSKGGTTKVIDRLEAKNLVHRTQDPSDRRALVVEITPEGREMLAVIRPIVDAGLHEHWGRHMTDEEASVIVTVADRIVDANPDWFD